MQEEAIHLCLGQRIRPFLFDRILCGQDEKKVGQFVSRPSDGHLPFLHSFEQRGLRFRRRAVDFIGQDKVAENGALLENEFTAGALASVDLRCQ
jgi:hypothetical protein